MKRTVTTPEVRIRGLNLVSEVFEVSAVWPLYNASQDLLSTAWHGLFSYDEIIQSSRQQILQNHMPSFSFIYF